MTKGEEENDSVSGEEDEEEVKNESESGISRQTEKERYAKLSSL